MLMIATVFSIALILPPQQAPMQQDQDRPATPAPATAATATGLPPVTVTGQAAGEDPNREVCRRVQSTVGSNRARRICAPAWQWTQAREDGRNQVLRETPASQGPVIGGMGEAPPGRGF
jgi:hypothetical protein